MRSVEIIEVLPLLQPLVEETGVVDHHSLEHALELLVVDPMGSLHLAVQPPSARFDVDVGDAPIQEVPVEGPLEFGPAV